MSQWYTTQTERKATLTDFSLASRCYYDSYEAACYYYLRSTGLTVSAVCSIGRTGHITYDHNSADYNYGVRPAFVLNE